MSRLPLRIRQRLDAFAEALDDLSLRDLPLYGALPFDPRRTELARKEADRLAAERGWTDGLIAARRIVLDWLDRRFVELGPTDSFPGLPAVSRYSVSVRDRIRIGQTLADAIRAVVFWDELAEADRDQLLGPWAALVEPT